jgi:hypothetical protein
MIVRRASFVNSLEAEEESGDNPFDTCSTILGITAYGVNGITDSLVPKHPIRNNFIKYFRRVIIGAGLLCKAILSGTLQSKFKASKGVMNGLAVDDGRATGAVINVIFVVLELPCTVFHFCELSEASAGNERTQAILEEVSNLTAYISRVAYAVAVNDDDPETKAIGIGVIEVANVAYAGLQTAEAAID